MTRPAVLTLRIAIGMIAVSFGAIFIRLAGEAPPLAIAAWRLTLAALVVVPLALVRRGGGDGRGRKTWTLSRDTFLWSILSGGALALHFVLWIVSLRMTSVASSALFVSTHPIFVGLGSVLFLRERLSRWLAVGIVLAVAGGGLVALGDAGLGASTVRGDLLALAGGAMAAVYFVIGRRVRRTASATEYVAVSYATAAIVVGLGCLATRTPVSGFELPTYGFLVLLALVPQLLGHSTFNWALRRLSATKVSILVLSEPIGAAVLAYAIFGESLTWLNLVGAAIILIGITVSLRAKEDPHVDRD